MNRRSLLHKALHTTLLSTTALIALKPQSARAFANACALDLTPKQTKGPFYPVADQIARQLDKDADLIAVEGQPDIAKGQIVIVEGKLTDQHCVPVAGALVEIWQACASGRYNHPSDPNKAELDPNFQYWGKSVTDADGVYRFRTLIPGSYQADVNWRRPPHIHFKVAHLGYRELITQMYFAGEALNERDLILQDLEKADQKKVIVGFQQQPGSPHPVGVFDIQIQKITRA